MWPSAASVAARPTAAAAAPALGGVTAAAPTAAGPCARPDPPPAALDKAPPPPPGAEGVWADATAAAAAAALAVAAASSANRRGPATITAPNVLAGGFWLLPVPSPLSTPSTPSTAAPAPNPGSKAWRAGKGLKRLIGVSAPNRAAGALSTAADPEPDLRIASPEPSLRVTEGAASNPRPCHWRLLAVTVAPPADAVSGELLLEVTALPPAAAVAMPPARLGRGAGVKLGPGLGLGTEELVRASDGDDEKVLTGVRNCSCCPPLLPSLSSCPEDTSPSPAFLLPQTPTLPCRLAPRLPLPPPPAWLAAPLPLPPTPLPPAPLPLLAELS